MAGKEYIKDKFFIEACNIHTDLEKKLEAKLKDAEYNKPDSSILDVVNEEIERLHKLRISSEEKEKHALKEKAIKEDALTIRVSGTDSVKNSPKTEFLLGRHIVKNGFVLIAGDTASFKTINTMILTKHLANGKDFLDMKTRGKFKVLYIDTEIGPATQNERDNAINKWMGEEGMENFHMISDKTLKFNLNNSDKGDWSRIKGYIKEHKYDIVVMDPLTSAFDENDRMSDVIRTIYRMFAEEMNNGVTFIGVDEITKNDSNVRNKVDKVSGAKTKTYKADSVILIQRVGKTSEFTFEFPKLRHVDDDVKYRCRLNTESDDEELWTKIELEQLGKGSSNTKITKEELCRQWAIKWLGKYPSDVFTTGKDSKFMKDAEKDGYKTAMLYDVIKILTENSYISSENGEVALYRINREVK